MWADRRQWAAPGGVDDDNDTAKQGEGGESERYESAAKPATRDWSALTFAALLEEAKSRGVPSSGTKASLVIRLEAHEAGRDSHAPPQPMPATGGLSDATAKQGEGGGGLVARDGGGGGGTLQPPIVPEEPVKKYASDLIVVLDLDQCLIDSHVSYPKETSDEFMERLLGKNWKKERWINQDLEHWRFPVNDNTEAYVTPRPGVREFVRNVTGQFETHVFTSAYKVYAGKVLDRLDPDGTMLAGRWYAVYTVDFGNSRIKDLNVIFPGRDLRRVVLVDDKKVSMLANPSNGIFIPPFMGLDPDDAELDKVWELLLELDKVPDVRPILEEKFGVAQKFAPYLDEFGDKIKELCSGHRKWADWALKAGACFL